MPSFDVTTGCDLQEVDNALQQARKELDNRFDFKGTQWSMDLDRKAATVLLQADDATKLDAMLTLLHARMVKRGVPLANVRSGPVASAGVGRSRRELTLAQGISPESAREIVACIKGGGLKKVQASIQGELVRVSAASRDDLQATMRLLQARDFKLKLHFGNRRD